MRQTPPNTGLDCVRRSAFGGRLAATCLAASLLLSCSTPAEKPSHPIDIARQEEGFLVSDGDRPVLFYQLKPKSLNGEYERSNYIHPLYSLDGDVLTEDFPPDHLHQRGVFWTWHQVIAKGRRIGDPWVTKNFSWDLQEAEALDVDEASKAIKARLYWKSPEFLGEDGKPDPIFEETTVVRVHRAEGDLRKIDFEIRLVPLHEDSALGGSEDEKGYGGFSPRIRLPEDIAFTGRGGAVTPRNTAVEGGPWIDLSGTYNASGEKSGVAILCHPSLPGFPQRWILRAARSMQNPVYPGRDPVPLEKGKPVILRYRLIVHRGDAGAVDLDRLQQEYEAEPLPKL